MDYDSAYQAPVSPVQPVQRTRSMPSVPVRSEEREYADPAAIRPSAPVHSNPSEYDPYADPAGIVNKERLALAELLLDPSHLNNAELKIYMARREYETHAQGGITVGEWIRDDERERQRRAGFPPGPRPGFAGYGNTWQPAK
jgi:hypothetical protein